MAFEFPTQSNNSRLDLSSCVTMPWFAGSIFGSVPKNLDFSQLNEWQIPGSNTTFNVLTGDFTRNIGGFSYKTPFSLTTTPAATTSTPAATTQQAPKRDLG